MYAVTTEDEELVNLIANTGKQEAAAPANKDDQRALEIAQVGHLRWQLSVMVQLSGISKLGWLY